jgi:hypothetical protein
VFRHARTAVFLLGAGLCSSAASAEPTRERATARLVYERGPGAEECADARAFGAAVAERLGYVPFDDAASGEVRVAFRRDKGKPWRAMVTSSGRVPGETRTRELSSPTADCADLGQTVALTTALLLDPAAALGAPPPPARPAPAPPSVDPIAWHDDPQAIPSERPALAPAPAPAPVHVALGAGGTGTLGAVPAPAPGGEVFAEIQGSRWALLLDARVDAAVSTANDAGLGVRASLVSGTVAPCLARAPLFACALVSAGSFAGEGSGSADHPRLGSTFYAAFGARLAAEVPLFAPLFLRAHADAIAPATRTRLTIGDAEIWTTPALAAAFGLGVGARVF